MIFGEAGRVSGATSDGMRFTALRLNQTELKRRSGMKISVVLTGPIHEEKVVKIGGADRYEVTAEIEGHPDDAAHASDTAGVIAETAQAAVKKLKESPLKALEGS